MRETQADVKATIAKHFKVEIIICKFTQKQKSHGCMETKLTSKIPFLAFSSSVQKNKVFHERDQHYVCEVSTS